MPMQAKAEGVKLFHAKAQLWALLGFVLMLLWLPTVGPCILWWRVIF